MATTTQAVPGAPALETGDAPAPARVLKRTKKRTLSRRGVMWLGQTCNARCYFCYFINRIEDHHHPEHPFMSIEKAKHICSTLRYFYGNTAIDIQGGEPTIFKGIFDLIRHCRDIGLYPTLITNGLMLGKPGLLEKFRDAGTRDFLVSLHGIGEIHDEVVGVKGGYKKIIAAIERMRELGIPFRFNCTMSEPVVKILPEVAQKAIEYGALAVNFIAFNPFGDQQSGTRTARNVARYSDIKEQLTKAMDLLEDAGIEVNVRYMPLCMAEPRHRKNFYNYKQLSYDHHEWDYASWLWTMMQTQMMRDGNTTPPFHIGYRSHELYKRDPHALLARCEAQPFKMAIKFRAQRVLARLRQLRRGKAALYIEEAEQRAEDDCAYQYHEACRSCHARHICDGFHGDYAGFFGTDEAAPITDMPETTDPLYFIRDQEKLVEPEDERWAL
ncbi:MAG TPA: radical SAM protein [Candidatus Hydrogenedentes bacterium]|nr:radical SAM protein [Candidatus Hydrogenedentota bacterium]HNT87884.1 radical SAM protein [Candidatus Hydrogenedentota bacterium]